MNLPKVGGCVVHQGVVLGITQVRGRLRGNASNSFDLTIPLICKCGRSSLCYMFRLPWRVFCSDYRRNRVVLRDVQK
jgi:hypothetical protein